MADPICLHPDNPHYLLFRGQPTLLISSAEHYGAVINLDFDYATYLDEMQATGMNLSRVWSGAYCEAPGRSFNITDNTLAPKAGRLVCPWARTESAGYANGGNKFDLSRWDEAYFRRLKDYVTLAGQRGVVLEIVLFCPYYEDHLWDLSPLNIKNNVNGIGDLKSKDVNTLHNGNVLAVQDAMVRKIVTELKDFDNLYYEVCNEPYFGGVTRDWQDHIIATIMDTERGLGTRHLIAQGIANEKAKIEGPNPAVSIFNFHYASPPVTVAMNWGLNKVIADDETGFKGTGDFWYRREGWQFILAGGGIYDNLDYSFTAATPRGTFVLPEKQPGGGGVSFRRQMKVLRDFMAGVAFVHMKPDTSFVKSGSPGGAPVYALAQPGKAYALYLHGGTQAELTLDLPAGGYVAQWVNAKTGAVDGEETFRHAGGEKVLKSPVYVEDVALRIEAK